MRVLCITNMYPTALNPQFGIFVREQAESIRQLGHDVDVLFINGREGRFRRKAYAFGFPRLWHALSRTSYDVVHAHYIFSGVIARAQLSAPLVLTHHGSELRDPLQGRLSALTRNWPEEIIVVSKWMAEQLLPRHVHVIPCGVDLNLFRPGPKNEARRRLGLEPNRRIVLFAGYTWDPLKRFELLRRAMELLRRRQDDVELVAVCGRPHDLIPVYMDAADVLAMTSISEGSAQVVKEAMACNLPVVATDAGDNWEVIGDTPGCYRTSSDPEEIAAKLEEAISPPRRTEGRTRVERFSLDSTAEAVVSVYEEAVRRRARPRAIHSFEPSATRKVP